MEIINFGDPPDILEEPDDDVTPKKMLSWKPCERDYKTYTDNGFA